MKASAFVDEGAVRSGGAFARSRAIWVVSLVAATAGLEFGCSDNDPLPRGAESASGGAGGQSQSELGGAGGAPNEEMPPSPPEMPPPLRDDPLYGEGGVAPEELRLVFQAIPVPGVRSATDIAFLPHQGDLAKSSLLMLSRDNRVHLVDLESGIASVRQSWDFADDAIYKDACAPTNVLLDRNFEENGFVYISKCAAVETTQLLRFVFDEEEGLSERTVIYETSKPDSQAAWHRMGSMGWESDEILWLLVGDHDDILPNETAQDVSNPLGALVRIMPNRSSGGSGHTIPPGNFAERPEAPENADPAIYAYGLRSPWRGTRDTRGRYWVGDVGLIGAEEVNLIVDAGENFGWSKHQGVCLEDCEGFLDPIAAYDRDLQHRYMTEEPMAGGSNQRAIWVGEIYEDPIVDRYEGLMDGVVPFGDLFVGFVRGLRAGGRHQVTTDIPIGLLRSVSTWKIGSDGYAYAADLSGVLHVALLDYAN